MEISLRDVEVVDVLSGTSKAQDLYIENGRFVAAFSRISADERFEVDCGGLVAVPGFIDTHIHMTWDGSGDPIVSQLPDSAETTLVNAVERVSKYLGFGVTTVRDLGASDDASIFISRAQAAGQIHAPRIIPAGRPLSITGGHDHFWTIVADGVDGATRAARTAISNGSGVIKVMATGGIYGRGPDEQPGTAEFDEEELRAIVREAHRVGLKVAVHALGSEGIERAIRSGVDDIQHGVYMTDQQIKTMVSGGIRFSPTVIPYIRMIENRSGTVPEYVVEQATDVVALHRALVPKAFAAGVEISTGSDSGSPDLPHCSVLDEAIALRELLPSDADTLRSLTVNGARVLGLEKDIGSIDIGKVADVVLLARNPVEDIRAIQETRMVLQKGQIAWVRGADISRLPDGVIASYLPDLSGALQKGGGIGRKFTPPGLGDISPDVEQARQWVESGPPPSYGIPVQPQRRSTKWQ